MSTTGLSSTAFRTIAIVLLIVGLIALALGIIYLVVPAHDLPSFMGKLRDMTKHRNKRAVAGLIAGGVLLIGATFAFFRARAIER